MNTEIIIPFLENLIQKIKNNEITTEEKSKLFSFLYQFSKINTNDSLNHSENHSENHSANDSNKLTKNQEDIMLNYLIKGWYVDYISECRYKINQKIYDKNDF